MNVKILAVAVALSVATQSATPAQQLTPAERGQIDSGAAAVLGSTGAPSASIAIVRGGQIVYERAYGNGRGTTAAVPSMRYAIGSVSKQFTAAAVLLLAEDGKLSLSDPVAKWYPQLTRARDVSIGQLLSMTSGYQDYWPQDYVFPDMQRPAGAQAIMERWAGAGKPLDFDPGTKWQYSNTNYVIAAAIVERVAGMPFMDFLRQRIFTPLKMTSVADFDAGPLQESDAGAYLRNGLGPLRPAPKEGKGWLFGAGQLAMTARDLATWNIAVMAQSLLRPASYKRQQTETLLHDGTATGYGLGVGIATRNSRRLIAHGGAVSGYTTSNRVYPDHGAAIVVFTNIYPGAADAAGKIAQRIANIILPRVDTAETPPDGLARRIYEGLVKGTIDRSLFTPSANAYFTQEVVSDYASSLGPLGSPREFTPTGKSLRGGMVIRSYQILAGSAVLDLTMMTLPDGKIDQYLVSREGTTPSQGMPHSLFNGRDLGGWHVDIPAADTNARLPSAFAVRNGVLVSLGEPRGHLITDSSYADYRLEVEYRFPAKPGNAGVLVHASTPRALYGMFPRSVEVQLEHGNAGDFWCILEDIQVPDMESRRGPRADWGTTEGKARRIRNLTDSSEKPLGEWNTMVIEAVGRALRVWVNGDLVNDGLDATADRGQIALQAEGSEVEFRKLLLTPISKQ